MTTEDDQSRFLCLLDELETSRELLRSGFGHLQEIDMGSTFYHLPHQLLASGFERLDEVLHRHWSARAWTARTPIGRR